MELLIVLAYASVCIALFALLRIPLTRVSVPVASIGGMILVFALVQLLNFFHPYTSAGGQYTVAAPTAPGDIQAPLPLGEPSFVAWFSQNSRFRIHGGAAAEVSFDSIPGKVFSARVREIPAAASTTAGHSGMAVLIDITDPRFQIYRAGLPREAHARAAIYGENLQQLAVLRKTLLRMSAWLNYLTAPA